MSAQPLEYLSHSRLSCFRSCSIQFRYRYVDKLAPAFTPLALAFGIAFHVAVEHALMELMAGIRPRVDELVKLFTASLDEQASKTPIRFGEREDQDSSVELATRMLTAWCAWERPKVRIVGVEHEFRVPVAEWLPPLIGRVDLIEVDEAAGFTNVIDIKSSRGKWGPDDLVQHAGQLALYRAAVADLVRDIRLPVRVGFEIITKTKNPVVERLYLEDGGETIDRQVRAATIVLEAVEREIFIPSPSKIQCSGCPFQEQCRIWPG